jgi:hypothetical protein
MYLMACIGERGRNAVVAQAVRETTNREDAQRIIADELPRFLRSIFQPAQLELIRERINQLPAFNVRPALTGRDWLGALGVCILVVLSTFPVVIPFIFFEDARLALRTSNAFAVISLFICGYFFARHAGLWPWTTGVIMVRPWLNAFGTPTHRYPRRLWNMSGWLWRMPSGRLKLSQCFAKGQGR